MAIGLLCLCLVSCGIPGQPSPRLAPTATSTSHPVATLASTSSPTPRPTAAPTVVHTPTAGISLTSPTTLTAPAAGTAKAGPMVTTTASLSITEESGPEASLARFGGCWGMETPETSFEIQLREQGRRIVGSFLLVKMRVVGGELTASRIREGTIQGRIVTEQAVEARLIVADYDDEGTARLTLAPDGRMLRWEEIDYPTLGLADPTSRFLPQAFILVPCGG